MVAFNSQPIRVRDNETPDLNVPKEGLVYSTDNGIYLFRGDQKEPREGDVLIAPVGFVKNLCYHKGNGAPDGALFDSGGLDFSRIRLNRIRKAGGYTEELGVFNTLTNELVSRSPNSVQVLCSSGGELFDAGVGGHYAVDGYTYHFRNTFTGEDFFKKYGLHEKVSEMCSHEGELYYGTLDGEIRKRKEIIAKRKGYISGLVSVGGVLYDGSSRYKERIGEIRNTLTGEVIRQRETTCPFTPTLISFNGVLLDLNYTGSVWELRETFSDRKIPIGESSSGKSDICAVGSIGPNLVKRLLERTEW